MKASWVSHKKRISKEKLLIKLRRIAVGSNRVDNNHKERGHILADQLLLQYIHDEDIELAFRYINKWYS